MIDFLIWRVFSYFDSSLSETNFSQYFIVPIGLPNSLSLFKPASMPSVVNLVTPIGKFWGGGDGFFPARTEHGAMIVFGFFISIPNGFPFSIEYLTLS